MGLLDKAAQRLLDGLKLVARPRTASRDQGGHRSAALSQGLEFADHRAYVAGDDVRHIDWKAFARHKQLTLRLFEEEKDVRIYILLDISSSMTRGAPSKIDMAKKLAASIGYLGTKQLDRVMLVPFASELGRTERALRSRSDLPNLERRLDALVAEGVTSFAKTARAFLERHPGRGLVFVVSDLMEATDWDESLRMLARLGHELRVIRVTCAEDYDPVFRGEMELVDAERGETVRISVDGGVLEAYKKEVRAHADRVREACLRVGGTFAEADATEPLVTVLRRVLARSAEAA